MNRLSKFVVIGVMVSGLAACGGGGDSPAPVPDATPPTVVSVTPANSMTGIAPSTTVSVNFSEPVNCSTVNASSVALTSNGVAVAGSVSCSGSGATFAPSASLPRGSAFTLSVTNAVKDSANNALSSAFSATFMTATAPPAVTYGVSGALAGLNSGRGIALQLNGGSPVSLTTNGTFSFAGVLDDGAAYNVVIASQPFNQQCTLANATGVIRAANVSNLTVLCVDVVAPPTVVSVAPANNATAIALSTTISASFSDALDCVSVSGASVTLTSAAPAATPVAGSVACSGSSVTFTPAASLPANSTFTLGISTAVRSFAGAALANAFSSTFTTADTAGNVQYSIGGDLTGLVSGRGLALQLNVGNGLSLTRSGAFVFTASLANGAAYNVSVLTQPSEQTCVVSNGSGTVGSADVANIAVSCTVNTYTVNGTLAGLGAGKRVTLQNNGADEVMFTGNGVLTFRTALPALSTYDVTVSAQPEGQTCTVVNGRGTVGAGNVNGVGIQCVDNSYAVGGTVSGLGNGNTLNLQNNGGDTLVVSGNGSFSFAAAVVTGGVYSVAVAAQPQLQICTVSDGSGSVAGTNITNVLVSCSAVALPSASTLSVALGLKQLQFSWTAAGNATYYKLMSTPDGVAPYTQVGADVSGTSANVDVSVHLVDWANSRYRVDACNPGACTSSAAIDAVTAASAAIGYFKASNTGAGDRFGFATALSGDGRTLAISAITERSAATGVDGDGSDNSVNSAGAVYVFARASNGWALQAYLKPSNTQLNMFFGYAIALNRDGNILAVGAPQESSCATQIGGDQLSTACALRGATYIFERSATVWSQQAYIKGRRPNNDSGSLAWFFGGSLGLNEAGDGLVVGAPWEDSARGDIIVGSNPVGTADHSKSGAGAAFVFSRSGGAWSQEAYLKASNSSSVDASSAQYGRVVAMSGDGDTVAIAAPGESSASTTINGNESYDCNAALNCRVRSGAVYLVHRTRLNAVVNWTQEAHVKSPHAMAEGNFGGNYQTSFPNSDSYAANQLSLNLRGDTLAVANPMESKAYVFTRSTLGGAWLVQAELATPVPTFNPSNGLMTSSTALSGEGDLLAVSGDSRVQMYRRNGASWASATLGGRPPAGRLSDTFGASLAMSADGTVVAVGASHEFSNATLIGGDQTDQSAANAGAVYLY